MTRLALLGSPVDAALSPVLHRAAYAAMGLPWTYHAIACQPQDLPRFLGTLDGSWRGFSLTMPLKRTVVPLLDEASETVTRIGAANTIVVTPNGRLIGENTDLYGMMQALLEADVTTATTVTVLGAGATACTALAAARELGCDQALVIARDTARAHVRLGNTAERIGIMVNIEPWAAAGHHLAADLVVSALPPHAADALASLWTRGTGTLMDVVYRPWPSRFAHAAQEAGRCAVGGLPMLVHQAARQVVLQTGHSPAPVTEMLLASQREIH
ncbi:MULTISPECIES: shikimate dehydrogenase [Streptomyces]|uniref:Shikimate dehydrogenase n=1 Tax=Streptomyces dengpaensis TaxID=2049881 RepID=A0ABM6SLL6_9ACTN|nr:MULTISPECIES: shikimate dehydrogenase [Streptomyces]AVH55555.1 shikimate dehydrogenase [Streptomyces dengpaensis]PIB11816.1 shikimate dehydrogenase [Streptomyces sp. HG99]